MLRGGGKRVVWSRGLLASVALVTATSAGFTAGCMPQESKSALGYAADAKRAYDDAMVEFDDKNWLEAQASIV